ncbi:MAG: DUF2786 domain-containing protein, partial [Thermodesulfobacteriota bacterium]|nr:DUF2786 domain-containing protein [Thermodesulfobacteriota bacterium]
MDNFQWEIREKLENQLVEKLKFEWDQAVWTMKQRDPQLAGRIKQPGILLSDMKSLLGVWNTKNQEILLSRNLVLNGRWDSICEVLRHEMAHQLASTFPEQQNEKPHGKIFIECCKILCANPKASGSYQTLEQRIWGNEDSENDKMMLKVKKLMSLASSANRHEAESAAAKANQLIARYNIDIIKNDKKRNFESIIITSPCLKRTQSEKMASIILMNYYFVKTVWMSVYMPEKQRMGRVLEISGTPSNIKIADYIFHYILKYAENCWQKYKKENPSCRSRSGFMTGVVNGFSDKLDNQKAAGIKQQHSDMADSQAVIAV